MAAAPLPTLEGFEPEMGLDGEAEMVEATNIAKLPDDTAEAGSRTPKKEDHQPGTLGEAFAKSRFDPGLCDAICAALGGDQDTETDILASMPTSEIEGLVNELVLETGLPPRGCRRRRCIICSLRLRRSPSLLHLRRRHQRCRCSNRLLWKFQITRASISIGTSWIRRSKDILRC